jgi:CubicO group peptidase (beta-lactamase class C family)
MADVAHFLTALIDGKVFAERATLETMLAPRSTEMAGYGLGIFGANAGGLRGHGHSGFWGTTAMVFPDAGVTIAIAVTDQGELRLANGIISAVLQMVGVPRVGKISPRPVHAPPAEGRGGGGPNSVR